MPNVGMMSLKIPKRIAQHVPMWWIYNALSMGSGHSPIPFYPGLPGIVECVFVLRMNAVFATGR
jgi:hypothetical protein